MICFRKFKRLPVVLLGVFLGFSCVSHTREVASLRRAALLVGELPGQYRSHSKNDFLRFLVFGDFGSGNPNQSDLAKEMQRACQSAGRCDFALVVGDNIYGRGVKEGKEADLQRKFEIPYGDFARLDFWLVPGNHDWYSSGSVQREIDHSLQSSRWRMPFNHFPVPDLPEWIHIYGIDTTIFEQAGKKNDPVLRSNRDQQLAALRSELCGKPGWRLLFGHHPVYSGGTHGGGDGILKELQESIEPVIRECRVQVYFAGHDHHQEFIQAESFRQVVQGAGGEDTRSVKDRPGLSYNSLKRFDEFGFALVELTPARMRLVFFLCGKSKVSQCRQEEAGVLGP